MPEQPATRPREAKKPPTIYEVARLAGVSHQTVSRFLRKDPTMRPDTVRKVAQAVQELNYRPNLAARSMRTRRTNRIAVILPDSTSFVPTRMLSGAAAAAHEAGYLLDVVGLGGDAAARAARIGTLLQPENVDGILSFTPLAENMEGLAPSALRVPIVVDGEYDDHMRSRGLLADATPAADIVAYLAGLGHRRFVHVAGPRNWASAWNRRRMYERAVAEQGLISHAVVDGDWSVRSGWDAARDIVAGSGVTAVFAANDQVAFGVIRGLQSLDIDVPGEVSVFGWDDDELGRYFDPPLSTVAVDRERQGRAAFERLLSLLQGDRPAAPLDTTVLNRLVPRGSTGPAPSP
ncbi:LacI family DNA-binding transcriptional regulator [Streptomyces profundus]|uniref:LacI family DNA-binding transcriptional regulator n=1 Tax=Streptomyces profundus TaxID=2867410 RepID=UPI001D15EB26|nr:LacI family DNA-binding transcriptional regulator [Streptomyces sp. MA3_2.13]UED87435.1 LacI family transcriptional regulator [Streptomyces sp. MA3_2.13]